MAPPTVYKSHRTPIYIHSTACNITTGIKRPDDSMSKNVPPKLKNDTTTGNGGSAKCQLVRSLTKRNEKASYMSTRVLCKCNNLSSDYLYKLSYISWLVVLNNCNALYFLITVICVTVFELAVVYLCLFGIFVQNSTLVVPYGAKIITEASTYWICVWICFYTDGYYCPLDSKILIAVDDDLIFSSSAKITVIVMLLVTFFFYKTALCFLLVESIDTIDRLSSSSIISNQTTYSQPGESQAISSTGDGLNMSIMRGNTLAIIDDSPPKYAELFA